MSTNRDDILESITDEKTRELAGVLMRYRPKVSLDRDFQRELRKSLTLEREKTYHRLQDISWFGWMTSIGMVSASLIAIIGLYQIFQSSTLHLSIQPLTRSIAETEDATAVYTEEKAIQFAHTPPPVEPLPKQSISPLPEGVSDATSTTLEDEIADIATDLLTTEKEADTDAATLSLAGRPTLRATPALLENMAMGTSNSSMISVSAPITPSYPSMMNLYSKPTPWESYEIANRSGTGVTIQIVRTEKSDAIETKSRGLIRERAIISATILYLPLSKIVSDSTTPYYLVPTIDYRLEGEAHVYIPLVRGYR